MTREEFTSAINAFNYTVEQRRIVLKWFDECSGAKKQEVIQELDQNRILRNAARFAGRMNMERGIRIMDDGKDLDNIFHIFACEIKKIDNINHIDRVKGMMESLLQTLAQQEAKVREQHIQQLQDKMKQIQQELFEYGITSK